MLKVFKQSDDIVFERPRNGDAGFDLRANGDYTLHPSHEAEWHSLFTTHIGTGVHLEIPRGYVGLIKEKSGFSAGVPGRVDKRGGIAVRGGVIDSSYRGEIVVVLQNLSRKTISIKKGQKIAQIVIVPFIAPEAEFVTSIDEMSNTERDNSGFGSTGDF